MDSRDVWTEAEPRPPTEVAVDAACPACQARGLALTTVQHELAWFGRTLETLLRCRACGFRHADFMVVDQRDPTRLALAVARPEHLWARVVRSNSCTWSVPELGFRAEPTSTSEAFVTNVEGLLDRAADVIQTAASFHADDPEKGALALRLLERCRAMQEGKEPATIVLEDPFGNSAIVHEDVERRALTPEEVAALNPGLVVFDKSEVKAAFAEDA